MVTLHADESTMFYLAEENEIVIEDIPDFTAGVMYDLGDYALCRKYILSDKVHIDIQMKLLLGFRRASNRNWEIMVNLIYDNIQDRQECWHSSFSS